MHHIKLPRRSLAALFAALIILFATPVPAYAHGGGGQPAALAGALAWGFLGFGAFVILIISLILFTGKRASSGEPSAAAFASLHGLGGYIARIRLFSRNARLFMVHVVGMDVIYGTWSVLFNLYLLAAGFDITFVGLRILASAVARAVTSVPAGLISDRIGRKLSFVLGDGVGALMSLIAISTTNRELLLLTGAIGGVFSALHGVAEPAFMAENSEDYERVHLFSVSDGTRTAAAIIGAALAGLLPLIFAGAEVSQTISVYRTAAYLGIGGWFASLIPAVMLRQTTSAGAQPSLALNRLFANVKHPDRIWRLIAPEIMIGLGAGFALPLMNIFFRSGVGSEEVEIGAVFAAGQAFLVIGSFLAPVVAGRLGKARSVVWTRAASIPFILLLAYSFDLGGQAFSVLSIAGLAYIGRITLMNMAGPVRSAFAMELLDAGERGTQVGIEQALFSAVSGITSFLGARMMDAGNFQSPFLLMAGFYSVAAVLFWLFFVRRTVEVASVQPASS